MSLWINTERFCDSLHVMAWISDHGQKEYTTSFCSSGPAMKPIQPIHSWFVADDERRVAIPRFGLWAWMRQNPRLTEEVGASRPA